MTKNAVIKTECLQSPSGSHYWLCDSQDGPLAEAHCKYCEGKTRFQNSLADDPAAIERRKRGCLAGNIAQGKA